MGVVIDTMSLPVDLMASAYHEAGHAVMGWLQNNPIRERGISIAPDGTGHCHIGIRAQPWIVHDLQDERNRAWSRWAIDADLRDTLAGPISEKRHRGVRLVKLPGGSGDFEQCHDTIERAYPGKYDRTHRNWWLAMLHDQTQRLLRLPRRWRAVETLATALHRRGSLTDDEAWEMLEASLGEPGELDFPPFRAARRAVIRERAAALSRGP